MEEKKFHELMETTHILGVISMYGSHQQSIHDRRTMIQTPEVVAGTLDLHRKCEIMERTFERKIVDIIRKHSTPDKDKKNETQY